MVPAIIVVLLAAVVACYFVAYQESNADADQGDEPMQFTDAIVNLGKAIAVAEGYGVANAIPTLANNPGDLILPNWIGPKMGSKGISVLQADSADNPLGPDGGWYRLFKQLSYIANGSSRHYKLTYSLHDMAVVWTGSDHADDWASNVATYLGVSTDTPLGQILA